MSPTIPPAPDTEEIPPTDPAPVLEIPRVPSMPDWSGEEATTAVECPHPHPHQSEVSSVR